MVSEGSPTGDPSVCFDPKKRANYHLDRHGRRVYHEVPEGHKLDKEGVPQSVEPAAPPEEKTDA